MPTVHPSALSLPAAIERVLSSAYLSSVDTGRSDASVWYTQARGGMYLKIDAPGALRNAALMQEFFHRYGLSAPLEAYESGNRDYLLVRRVHGENGISRHHMSDPVRLARTMGETARRLHETDLSGCPVSGRTRIWRADLERAVNGNAQLIPHIADYLRVFTWESALREVEDMGFSLDENSLVHGDLCLPNYMMDDFQFTGLIDLGGAGAGDRHYDLFWSLWSLSYNFGSDRFRDVFLDAYGRDRVDEDRIRFCGLMNCLNAE